MAVVVTGGPGRPVGTWLRSGGVARVAGVRTGGGGVARWNRPKHKDRLSDAVGERVACG